MGENLADVLARIKERAASPKNSNDSAERPTLVKSIRGIYKLPTEEIERHRAEIIQVESAQDKCRGCTSRDDCRSHIPGYIPIVQDDLGRYCEALTPCKWERQRQKQRRMERAIENAGIPPIYRDITLKDCKLTAANRKAINAAQWATGDKRASLYIYGTTGTGKTMIASAIANETMSAGRPVLFVDVPALMADIRAGYDDNSAGERLQAVIDAPFLILDDLGAERGTEWVSEQLFKVINARYASKRQTIITSNYALDELADHFAGGGERIVSRIYGMCARVGLTGQDWRMLAS